MPMIVSRTVVWMPASAQVVIVYSCETLGVNLYQTLRERLVVVRQLGADGSPVVVAAVISRMLVVTGLPPSVMGGIVSALLQRSFAGAAALQKSGGRRAAQSEKPRQSHPRGPRKRWTDLFIE